MKLPAGHILGAAPFGVDGSVGGHEGVLDHDVLAAAPPHAGREPRVDDLVVGAREQEPQGLVGARAGHGYHDPGGRVAAAREAPPTRDPEPAARGLDLAAGRVQAAGEERVRPGREELLLTLSGKVAQPPVVRRPERIAPRRRAAAATELESHLEGRVHLDVVAAVPAWITDPDETGGQQILDTLREHLPELFRARRALLQDRDELGGSTQQLAAGQRRMRDPG